MDGSRLVIAANRGPVSFGRDDSGALVTKRGGGGLVASLAPLVEGTGATWVGAAMGEADREATAGGVVETSGLRYRCLDIDAATYRMGYDVIANSALWFVHHHLFDLPRRPAIDRHWHDAWDGFRAYNQMFGQAVADEAPEGALVLVQDYHLSLLAAELAAQRPDLRLVHFHHTPFAEPAWLSVLPDEWVRQLLGGLASFHACGFHSARWERSFLACCQEVLGVTPRTFVSGLPAAVDDLAQVAASDACAREGRLIDEVVGDRKLIVRVDRMELSKNIVRGFLAYEELLARREDLRGQVVFLAYCYPSRETLPEYVEYRADVETTAQQVNDRWGTREWSPVVLNTDDNFARSVTALTRYDALLVNPVRDGMNLVAKEGAALNRNDGVVVLSRQAGAWDELSEASIGVNPFDVTETADALDRALAMPAEERRRMSAAARSAATARSLRDWLDDQLAAVGETL
ncbi:MAG TPA: trehalose-6-phosphate synthase [Acidimicrobiales bacterium]|nr:trehalose-6-phosphate synthase [Acidimicrobiales bacterium]